MTSSLYYILPNYFDYCNFSHYPRVVLVLLFCTHYVFVLFVLPSLLYSDVNVIFHKKRYQQQILGLFIYFCLKQYVSYVYLVISIILSPLVICFVFNMQVGLGRNESVQSGKHDSVLNLNNTFYQVNCSRRFLFMQTIVWYIYLIYTNVVCLHLLHSMLVLIFEVINIHQ